PPVRSFCHPPPTTEIYTLSLHDALPIFERQLGSDGEGLAGEVIEPLPGAHLAVAWVGVAHLGEAGENQDLVAGILAVAIKIVIQDRKSTRLNSSHVKISYAVFCLKKKKK